MPFYTERLQILSQISDTGVMAGRDHFTTGMYNQEHCAYVHVSVVFRLDLNLNLSVNIFLPFFVRLCWRHMTYEYCEGT